MVIDNESKAAIALGALAGALAWIVGYGLTYAASISDLRSNEQYDTLEAATDESLAVEMVGLLYYNAHNVVADVPQYSVLQALEPSHNFVLAEGGSTLALYAIPVLFLMGAGAVVTLYTHSTDESATDAALSGSVIVVGYLPLVVFGTFVFTVDPGNGAMAPDLFLAIGLAGTFYPLVLGALGGVVAHVVSRTPQSGSVSDPNST
ncbi:hypothetical protein [Natronolimnohabitans innermongolicus]|uniref:hypothetical protein n=1 Tax=Natronolimnohabitans innermongolicus TaxID=253107 RepID=UPI0012694227|nr:hypothetical protein [Natronolimnohabitans innermongolicus]